MQRTCSKGHLYDADLYPSCPYCNRGTQAIFFGADGGQADPAYRGGSERTEAPSGYRGGDTGRTAAPSGFGAQPRQQDVGPTVDPANAASRVDNSDPGKTQMPDSLRKRMRQEQENKTIGHFKKKHGFEPVVGWLVCVEGPDKGKDYRLVNRINSIGRDERNDVALTADQSISKENNAKIGYDPRHNVFTLIPGNNEKNLVYLNDQPLYIPIVLAPYDIIEMGDYKLVFIPLCSDRFHWPEEKVADKE